VPEISKNLAILSNSSIIRAPLRWMPALLALTGAPAMAQTTDMGWKAIVTQGQALDVRLETLSVPSTATVMGRYRPDYLPIGGRIGSFFLYPRLRTSIEATDNVFASNNFRASDLTTRLNGQALLTSSWTRHAFDAQLFTSQSLHARHATEDTTNYGGSLDGRLDIGRSSAITLALSGERGTLDRSDFTSPATALKPVQFDRYYAEAKAQHTFNRVQASAAVKFARLDYMDTVGRSGAPISQRFRDGDFWTYQATVSYRLREGVRLIANGTYATASYSLAPSDPLMPNNLNRNSRKKRIEGGLKFDFADHLIGSVRAGWIDTDYTDPRLRDFQGAAFSADLVWTIRRSTTLRLKADRRIDESSSTTSAGMRVTEGSLSAEHELRPNLLIAARTSYSDLVPLGPDPRSQLLLGSGEVTYLLNRRLSFTLNYLRQHRTSQSSLWQFDENRVMLQATLTL